MYVPWQGGVPTEARRGADCGKEGCRPMERNYSTWISETNLLIVGVVGKTIKPKLSWLPKSVSIFMLLHMYAVRKILWRVYRSRMAICDWPLPIAATRTATRIGNRTGGSRDQRNHWEGTRAQGLSSKYKGLQPLFPGRAGEKVQ